MISDATWSVWTAEEGLKAKCSICGCEVKQAVVFPECELGICFACLEKIWAAADNAKKEAEVVT